MPEVLRDALESTLCVLEELNAQPDLSIGEVAHACGISDSNYFSRRFRTASRQSPRDYRARLVHGV